MFRRDLVILIVLSFTLLWVGKLHAGTTGKIAGTVFDAQTNSPLAGVNIILEGTNRGAASDLDGIYYIINLPPGTYTMQVSAIGYARQEIIDVIVQVDRTTTVNIRLREEAIRGEEVVVRASRPAVEVDRTFSTATVGAQDLQVMPITRVQEAINLQAGVVDGHFRGGRSGEVVYMIDGIPVQDVYNNTQGTQVSQDVVKELQVITGTFNAEYGQAMSGVVNMVTKDGSDSFHGMVSLEMGDFASRNIEQFKYIDQVDPNAIRNSQFSLSGPLLKGDKPVSFYVNGRFESSTGWLYGEDRFDLEFPSTLQQLEEQFMEMTPEEQSAWLSEQGITPEIMNDNSELLRRLLLKYGRNSGDPVPMIPDVNVYLFGKLTYQISPTTKLNYVSMAENRDYRDFDRDYISIPDGDYKRFRRARTNSVKLTSGLNQSAFVDFGYSNNYTEYFHYVYEDIFDERYYYDMFGLFDLNPSYTTKIQGVKFEHFRRYSNSHVYQGKLSWQVNPIHYVVMGANFNYNEVFYRSLNDDIVDVGPTFNVASGVLPGVGDFNHDHYRYRPLEGAVYLQDKIELSTLVVNAGIRFDYFNSRGKVLADPKDPDAYHPIQNRVNQPLTNRLEHWYTDPTPKFQVSPRLGIGYPVSESGVLHFAYGHFFQRPGYEHLYSNPEFEIKRKGAGLHTVMGNADLDAEKTVSYELGFEQALTTDLTIGLSIYQRDIRGLISADRIVETYNSGTYYAQYVNRDIAEVQGFLLSVKKRYADNYSAGVDYTYQIAEGVASDPQAAYNAQSGDNNTQPIKQLIPLNWDRRHTINVNFNYIVPGVWGASVIGTLGSGLPYTIKTGRSRVQELSLTFENDGRKPTYMNVDLNAFVELPIFMEAGIKARFQLMVRNLMDRLNENDVYGDTGRATYRTDMPESRAGERPEFNTFEEFFLYNPQHYSRPREVRVGLSFEF